MKNIDIDKNRILSVLKKVNIFHYLSDAEDEEIFKICRIIQYEEGETIILEGEVNPYLYAVIEGTVSVMVKEKSGKEVYICSIGENDIFGEAGLFISVKRTANVIALDKLQVIQIERKNFISFIKNNPGAGLKILMLIVYSLLHKLREANQELAFERKSYFNQDEVDNMIKGLLDE